MILQPTVELTKVRYYGDQNATLPTISGTVFEKSRPPNVIIKRNVFGHRWVLKINEVEDVQKSRKMQVIAYSGVFCCILVALSCGLYLTLAPNQHIMTEAPQTPLKNVSESPPPPTVPTSVLPSDKTLQPYALVVDDGPKFCKNCTTLQICLKRFEFDTPHCVTPLDRKDPTGCGGFCSFDTQFCQLLDEKIKIYQCSDMRNRLKCPTTLFNCGNRCIPLEKRCNGIIDCTNKSDEMNCDCNLESHFHCGNQTSCLPLNLKCNRIVDCWDKSDEVGCKTNDCPANWIQCHDGACVPREHFCDGVYHCKDRSDEPQGC